MYSYFGISAPYFKIKRETKSSPLIPFVSYNKIYKIAPQKYTITKMLLFLPFYVITAQCSRPEIPNSDAASSDHVLHSGDVITVTCQDGYSNGESATTTLTCDHGSIMPDIPSCNGTHRYTLTFLILNINNRLNSSVIVLGFWSSNFFFMCLTALCSRPIIQNSDATTSYPVLHHGDVFIVTCNEGYSNGEAQTTASVCHQGTIDPTVSFCYGKNDNVSRISLKSFKVKNNTPRVVSNSWHHW